MSNPPQNFGELDGPLEMQPCLEKAKTHFKETKKVISNNEMRTHLKVEIGIYSYEI